MKDKKRQREIARMGGKAVSKKKGHLARIGRIGGKANGARKRIKKAA